VPSECQNYVENGQSLWRSLFGVISAKLHYTDAAVYGYVVQHHQRTSCRIVVSSFVGGVVQHVRSRCPCSGVWHLSSFSQSTFGMSTSYFTQAGSLFWSSVWPYWLNPAAAGWSRINCKTFFNPSVFFDLGWNVCQRSSISPRRDNRES